MPTATLLDNIVDRAATHGASRIYLAHAGGAGFEDEPSKLLASLEERGFDARTASTDRSVGFESLDPFDVSLDAVRASKPRSSRLANSVDGSSSKPAPPACAR